MCLANGYFAKEYVYEVYSLGFHNGNADAFRHILWCYGMTVDVGADFAKKWSNTHEDGATNNPKKEKKMDKFNNKVGINLGPEPFETTIMTKRDE